MDVRQQNWSTLILCLSERWIVHNAAHITTETQTLPSTSEKKECVWFQRNDILRQNRGAHGVRSLRLYTLVYLSENRLPGVPGGSPRLFRRGRMSPAGGRFFDRSPSDLGIFRCHHWRRRHGDLRNAVGSPSHSDSLPASGGGHSQGCHFPTS